MSEAWSQWQGQIIDGKFHLTQYLGGSGASAVFLAHLYSPDHQTQRADQRPVAIRLIANCDNPELQLSRWRMVQGIEHPHLIQLCDTGRCRLGDIDLIYAVMEYGDETVAQILPERPLTVEEAREMLVPTVDVLAYLHHRGLVHGHVKPANIMAIADQLKLSSDGIRPADQPVSPAPAFDVSAVRSEQFSPPLSGLYDAPETVGGVWSPAADVWSLGVTIAEVLTQSVPSRDELNQPGSDPLLPANLPVEFVEIVRGCLRRDLELRWTLPAIKARLEEDRGRAAERARVSATASSSVSSAVAAAGIESAAAVMTLEPPTSLAVTGSSAYSPFARDTAGMPSLAASGPTQNVSTARDKYPATSNLETAIALEEPEISSPAPPTFAQALRAKPVVSEKSSMSQERMVAAAASFPTVMPVTNAARADVIRIVDSHLEDSKMVVRVPEPIAKLNIIEEEEQSGLSRFLAQIRALQSRTVVLFAATIVKTRRLTSQARAALEQKTVSTRALIRRVATRTEDFLGLYPKRTIMRFAVAAGIVVAAMVALYMGLESLRHKPAAHVTHQAKAPLNVVVVKPEKKATTKKHASATQSLAKPQPGTPLAPVSPSRTQPAVPVQQTAAQTASAPSKQPAPQASTQAAAQTGSASSGTRRIDDGGGQENAPAQQQAGSGQAPAHPVGIAQQVMPQVSQSALRTIHGTVRVNVRVRVDPSGNVARVELASSGPSRYFARKSLEAAQNWKFAPGASSPYLVHFEFRNNGARAFATRVGS